MRRLWRGAAVVAVLLGVLAMHGVGPGHDAMPALPSSPAMSSMSSETAMAVTDVHDMTTAALHEVVSGAVGMVAVAPAGAPGAALHLMAAACLAVLAGCLTLVVLARLRSQAHGGLMVPVRFAAPGSGPGRHPPSRDPVADLCVSRT